MQQKGQIKIIQALRGIAAMMVMIYHKREVLNTNSVPFGEFFFGAAAMGVDLFFIVSGFIMVLVNQRVSVKESNIKSAWHFFVNRITRILPLYYFVIVLFYLLVWQGFSFFHDQKSLEQIGKSFLFIPLEFKNPAPFYGYAAITVGWTLNYEMFFYGLLTISLLFGKYKYWIFSIIIGILLLGAPLLFGKAISFDAHHHYHFTYGYLNLMSNPIVWDFVMGMMLGFWYANKKPHWNKEVYWFLLIVFSIWNALNLFAKWNAGHGVTHWAFPISGLVASLVFYENQYGIKVPKWLLFMGKISFSLYLLHPVVQYETQYLFNHHHLGKWIRTPIYLLVSAIISIAFATITQYLIENHFSKIAKKGLLFLTKKR